MIWLNGEAVTHLPATHRALHYGDGVFRTLKIVGGQVEFAHQQWQVLAKDATRLNLPPPDFSQLDDESHACAEGIESGVLKLMLLRAGAGRGYAAPKPASTDRLWLRYDLPTFPAAWRLGFSRITLAESCLQGVKHLNRLEQVLAASEMPSSVDEVLMSVGDDDWRCGSKTTLFWREEGEWCTAKQPTIEGLSFRRYQATPVFATQNRLKKAELICVANSLIGLRPVRQLGSQKWPESAFALAKSLPDLFLT
jgi:4-amino-4-deoxychorismate lyase